MAFTFFIKVSTEPIQPDPNKFGSAMSIILHNVPSQEAGEQSAKLLLERKLSKLRLSKRYPEQKVAECKVLSVYDYLLTSTGNQQLDWHWMILHEKDRYDDHRHEFHSSMYLKPPNLAQSENSQAGDLDVKAIKERIPDSERWNWDEQKQFYYIFYHEKRAFVVRSINMILAAHHYATAVRGTPDGDYNAAGRRLPGVMEFESDRFRDLTEIGPF